MKTKQNNRKKILENKEQEHLTTLLHQFSQGCWCDACRLCSYYLVYLVMVFKSCNENNGVLWKVFSAFTLITWISFVNHSKFPSGRQCQSSFNADSWQHLCSPHVLAVQTFRAGPPACLPPSVLRNPFSVPLSDLTRGNGSYNSLLGCAAINSLQVLFFGVVVIGEHWLFSSFVRSTTCLRAQATQIRYLYHLDPHWAAEVAPDPCAGTFPECVCQDRPSQTSLIRWEMLPLLSLTGVVSHRNLSLFS